MTKSGAGCDCGCEESHSLGAQFQAGSGSDNISSYDGPHTADHQSQALSHQQQQQPHPGRAGPSWFLFCCQQFFFQSGATKLKRSWSTGSGDKIQSKTLPGSPDITDKLIEAIPDLLTSLVINSHQTQLFGNNNLSEDKMMETLDLQLDIKDNFEPGQFGLMEDPGVISFDSLDYPEDLSDFDDDEVEMEEKVHNFSKPMLRFSFDDLISSRQFSKQEQKLRMRTKSLSDINEILAARQYSHREKTKKIS